MSAMSNTVLLNLSGRAIAENVRIVISGEAAAGKVLVIESFDGISGVACWRTEAELKSRRDSAAAESSNTASWPPKNKQRAPYS